MIVGLGGVFSGSAGILPARLNRTMEVLHGDRFKFTPHPHREGKKLNDGPYSGG